MAFDVPTLVAANSASNDTDYDAWVAMIQLARAGNAGQMQGSKNKLHNSACDVWQRGTSFASGATQFSFDRWQFFRTGSAAGATLSRQAGFSGARYCARVQRDNGTSGTQFIGIGMNLETQDAVQLAGKTVIVSADIRKGAGYSEASSQLECKVRTGTGTDEARSPNSTFATGGASLTPAAQTIATTEARIVFPAVTIAANTTMVGLDFNYQPSGTAGATDYFEITNMQMEVVDASDGVATPYERRPFAVEFELCEYYLQKSFLLATTPAQNIGIGTGEFLFQANTAGATTQRSPKIPFHRRMRVAPTITTYNPAGTSLQARDETNSVQCTALATVNIGEDGFAITVTGNAATTVGAHLGVHWLASAEI